MKIAFACVLIAAALPAVAQEKMKPATPDPMLTEGFGSAVGKWNCNGVWKMPDGKEMKSTSTMDIKKELGGFMYTGHAKYKGTKEMPASEMHMSWGMSPTDHKIMQTGYDSMGSSFMEMGDGWQGDVMKSEGNSNMMGKMMKTRTTVTRMDKGKKLTIVTEAENAGAWSEMGKDECKK